MAILDFASLSTITNVVIVYALSALGSATSPQFVVTGHVDQFEISGGSTVVVVEVDEFVFGQQLFFSGSGVFGATSGSLSGGLGVGGESFTVNLDGATVDDPDAPSLAGWTAITTEFFAVGSTLLPVDAAASYTMQLTPGGPTPVSQTTSLGAQPTQSTRFAFNPTVEITATLDRATGALVAQVAVVPEPGTATLIGVGLSGLAVTAARRRPRR